MMQYMGSLPCVHCHARRRRGSSEFRFKEEKWIGRLETQFKVKVTGADGTEVGKSLEEIQKQIEEAANTVNYSTRTMRHNAEKKTLEEVTNRGKAAARSTTNGKKSFQKTNKF